MIYLIGGASRTGKSILGQRFAVNQRISWISTDLLMELLRVKGDEGVKRVWDAVPQAIETNAEWFYPYLERFIWGVTAHVDGYVIEGVDFLPKQVAQLAADHRVRTLFLGCSKMTIDQFDRYPGKSPGYAKLPIQMRQQIVRDIPRWSEFIQREARKYGYPYFDIADDFRSHIAEAEANILKGIKVIDDLQLRPHLAQSYFHLGEFYAGIGRKEEAVENLNKALSMCQEMGIGYWPVKIQVVLDRL